MRPLDLSGRTALVTGGNRGIGLAAVQHLAKAGARVTFTARSEENIETNLVAAFHAIQVAVPGMVNRGGGTIVNLSSGAAHRPMEGWSAYCAGKAGLAMVTRCVHEEWSGHGIRAFGFAPGVVDTDMQGAIRASGINPVSQLPRASLAPPDHPGWAIAWLCTPEADGLAGQELDIRTNPFRSAAGLEPLQ